MILEAAVLHIKQGQTREFEASFKEASSIIASMKGYIRHELQSCIENDHQYILLVHWETLEDHTVGFRESRPYQEWKALLHHYYDPFPVVQHYEQVLLDR